jgi:hypothetical protein
MLWAGGKEMAPSSLHLTDGVPSIAAVQPVHVSTWIEASTRELDAPSGQAAPGSAAPPVRLAGKRPGRAGQPGAYRARASASRASRQKRQCWSAAATP